MRISILSLSHAIPIPGATDRDRETNYFTASEGYEISYEPANSLIAIRKSNQTKLVHVTSLAWCEPAPEAPKPEPKEPKKLRDITYDSSRRGPV